MRDWKRWKDSFGGECGFSYYCSCSRYLRFARRTSGEDLCFPPSYGETVTVTVTVTVDEGCEEL